jgi:hypothetical protein
MTSRGETSGARDGVAEKIFRNLARVFNGLHWGVGITTLPKTATSREERSFVLMCLQHWNRRL